MRRFVIDANTLVSGSVSPHGESPPCLLYSDLAGTRFELVVCPELLAEVRDALRKPYFSNRLSGSSVDDIVAGIAYAATVLEDPTDVEAVLRDGDDDYLVALAKQAEAEAIVTGDKDLLDHPGLTPPAMTARDACELVGLL